MFRCYFCGRVASPRTPARRVVLETRPKTYPLRKQVNRKVMRFVKGKWRPVRPDDPGGAGREIVREALACPACDSAR